ncbi:MAG: xanthine dehydrogenase family protein molybdopterin-binding subunit [Rubrivivax sp.]|nr:xanthine dehydrogenase family protein molybdopterin-binding subunit [Rubrivivax sp.]
MTHSTPSLDRRQFLGATGGLTLAFMLPAGAARRVAPAVAGGVNTWLTIAADDSVTLTIGSSDMGQGSFQGLGQVLAEDLMVDPRRIRLVQGGPTMASPAPIGTAINTVGSGVTRNNFWKLRDASAIARETLVMAAMNRHGDTTRANYSVADGVITHAPSGTTYRYGSVADDAGRLTPPASATLVPDAEFKSIGQPLPRQDIPAKVDGSAQYGLDVRLPGMVYAVIKHGAFGSTLAATPAVPPGMLAVVPTTVVTASARGTEKVGAINALAVVGPNTWDTWRAANALRPRWTAPADAAVLNSAQFMADARALAVSATPYVPGGANPPGTLYTVEGNPAAAQAAIDTAAKQLDVTYTLPYVAHACLEVLNCTVDYVAGVRCDVYVPTQSAKTTLSTVMAITGMTEAQVKIHTTLLGGGLGRKAEMDFVAQAVQVGMAVQRPVKLMWPREEDFMRDQYRPMALVHARAGLDAARSVVGWSYRNISPSIQGQRGAVLGATGDSQGYEASNALPYSFGARGIEWVSHPSPIPVGYWRSVGASVNTFAVESLMDELALAAGEDPYQFRRSRLTDPRWLAVLDNVATASRWGTPVSGGGARGIAIGKAFNTIVAQVVEIASVSRTGIKVRKITVVVDCYLAVNPASVEAQIIGGVVHGLNAALWGKQNFTGGKAQSRNFNRSRMLRLQEMPQVSVILMPPPAQADRAAVIGGIGELGVPTLAPALANAHAALTKKRQRDLPFFPSATMGDG